MYTMRNDIVDLNLKEEFLKEEGITFSQNGAPPVSHIFNVPRTESNINVKSLRNI